MELIDIFLTCTINNNNNSDMSEFFVHGYDHKEMDRNVHVKYFSHRTKMLKVTHLLVRQPTTHRMKLRKEIIHVYSPVQMEKATMKW